MLSNGNLYDSASETSGVSKLNLSQAEDHLIQVDSYSDAWAIVEGSTACLRSRAPVNRDGRRSMLCFVEALVLVYATSLGSSNSSLSFLFKFYNGRTMYGGALAYKSRRHIRRIALRVPVQIRPSSFLSNFSSNTSLRSDIPALLNTAKRILEIPNQRYNPQLNS